MTWRLFGSDAVRRSPVWRPLCMCRPLPSAALVGSVLEPTEALHARGPFRTSPLRERAHFHRTDRIRGPNMGRRVHSGGVFGISPSAPCPQADRLERGQDVSVRGGPSCPLGQSNSSGAPNYGHLAPSSWLPRRANSGQGYKLRAHQFPTQADGSAAPRSRSSRRCLSRCYR